MLISIASGMIKKSSEQTLVTMTVRSEDSKIRIQNRNIKRKNRLT